jgi:uncharacterized membrane protein (DUF2068 family)
MSEPSEKANSLGSIVRPAAPDGSYVLALKKLEALGPAERAVGAARKKDGSRYANGNVVASASMNPFLFSADDSAAGNGNAAERRWFPRSRRWLWPEDYRSAMAWAFALTGLMSAVNIARAILHPRARTLLQNLLIGPIFYSAMVIMAGIALWALWKEKSWARWWSVAASSFYLVEFFRQFMIPVRPTWDYHVSSLLIGMCGVLAFALRSKRDDVSRSGPSARG